MSTAPAHSVLIVDDDRTTRLLLAAELAFAGYRPVEATTGAEAIAALKSERCSIVITDWLMPDVDGLELCRRVRNDPTLIGTYLLMITVNSDVPRLVEAFEAGVDDFLPKPFEPGVLLARMRAASRTVDLQEALLARNAELEAANDRLTRLATTDDLTGLSNRRHGLLRLQERWSEAERHGRPLSLAVVDVDHFKRLNDTYGHAVGDRVLADVASVLRRSCRKSDALCRYGGEEFLCVLPDVDCAAARICAEHWREAVADHRTIEGALSIGITVSIGLATRSAAHRREIDLVRSADDALYLAKEHGRNLVRHAA